MSATSRQVVRGGCRGALFGLLAGALAPAALVAIVGAAVVATTPEPPRQGLLSFLEPSREEAFVLLAFLVAFPGAFVGAVIGAIAGARRAALASEKPTAVPGSGQMPAELEEGKTNKEAIQRKKWP